MTKPRQGLEALRTGLMTRAMKLASARRAELEEELRLLAQRTGWQYGLHHTGDTAQSALLWLYRALKEG